MLKLLLTLCCMAPSFVLSEELTARVSIVLLEGENRQTITPNHPFKSGDRFQFEVMSTEDALLSVVNRIGDQEPRIIWPSKQQTYRMNRQEEYRIPPSPRSFVFDESASKGTFYLVLSRVDQPSASGQAKVPENYRIRSPEDVIDDPHISSVKDDDVGQHIYFSSSGGEEAVLELRLKQE